MHSALHRIRRGRRLLRAFVALAAGVLAACVPGAVTTDAGGSPGRPAKLFVMLAETSAGTGTSGPVARFDVRGPEGSPSFETTISDPSFFRPCCFALPAKDEMFVMNRGDGLSPGTGYITRTLHPLHKARPNGAIASPDFSGPHWAAFRGGELFVAQRGGSNVLRFVFDSHGIAVPSGAITAGLCCTAPRGVAFSATGELFVTQCCEVSTINRYVFDGAGNAIPNGIITGGGLSSPHDLAFSLSGELFVANAVGDSVSRFTFDASGNASSSGLITSPTLSGPLGLAFSPSGELFVGSGDPPGGVSRWTFDNAGTATFNGSFSTPSNVVLDIQFGS
jgi:DNA-binding beta-propeller fold protein YncE